MLISNPGFCDESEQEISDHHKSESSDDIAEEIEISTASGDLKPIQAMFLIFKFISAKRMDPLSNI